MSRNSTIHTIRTFVVWSDFNNSTRLTILKKLEKYAEQALTECDTAVGHGPGHQSISPCEVTGPHTYHENSYHEWEESDIGEQTHEMTVSRLDPMFGGYNKVKRTYRLAFT